MWQGMALYVGAVVGSGILILPGLTGSAAGNNALLSWGIMIALSFPLAYSFAMLAQMYPSAGGVSTFVEKAFGRYIGAIIGWFYFVTASAGQFIVPLTGGVYVTYAFHLSSWATFVVAAVLLTSAIISNYFGLKTSGKVQLVVSGLVIIMLVVVIIFAIPHITGDNLTPHAPLHRLRSIGNGAMMIFWSFFGWEAITSLAPEFKNGVQDIMRATFGALVIVGLLYIGIAVAVVGTHSYSVETTVASQALNSASLAQVMNLTLGGGGEKVTSIVALLICLGTTNAFVASISRLAFSLAHEGVAPKWLDHINEKHSTPDHGVLLVAIFAGTGMLVTMIFHLPMKALVYIPNSLGIATYILGTAAGVKLLHSSLGKVCAIVACLMCLLAYPFIGAAIWIPAIVAAACMLYLGWHRRR